MDNKRKIDNVVVVGGGTAGWLSALYAKHMMPDKEVTLIESKDIGVLGAGEGTVPPFVSLMNFLSIPFVELVRQTGATIKNGVKFINWNGKDDYYYHSFAMYENLWVDGCNLSDFASSTVPAVVTAISRDETMNELDITTRMAEAGKVPFAKTGANESATYPLENYTNLGAFSIHFDAVRLAKYLRTVAEARGIKRVEGLVVDATQDEYGDLKKIILKSGLEVPCDFVFDASGFKRVLVGNKLGAEWVDYADKLPVNAAVPFFLPHNGNDIAPYTENIAMKHGWIWKVPVQHRIGCGYTYDSTQATKEEIIEEIEEYLGHKIEPVNFFTFNAGYYKTPWINNCIAVGLASGFVEPLEATSIWVTALTLQYALSNVEVLYSRDKRVADDLNKKFCKVNDQVSDFVYFHYMTERNDTEFWRKFSIENAPQSVKDVLSTWEYRLPQQDDYAGTPWTIHSWLQVGIGIGKANTELMKFSADNSAAHKHASTTYDELKHRGTVTVETMFRSHMDFLDDMNRVVEDK